MEILARVNASLKSMNLLREVFTFVDSSQLISKLNTWDDKDKTIKAGLEKFNNKTVDKVGVDKDARFGCKGIVCTLLQTYSGQKAVMIQPSRKPI